jgi:hypothetical protein
VFVTAFVPWLVVGGVVTACVPTKSPSSATAPASKTKAAGEPPTSSSENDARSAKEEALPDAIFDCPELPGPTRIAPVTATVSGFAVDGDMEVLELDVPLDTLPEQFQERGDAYVLMSEKLPGAASFVTLHEDELGTVDWQSTRRIRQEKGGQARVFIRRPKSEHGASVTANLYVKPLWDQYRPERSEGSIVVPFVAGAERLGQPEPAVLTRWAKLAAYRFHYAFTPERAKFPWESFGEHTLWERFAGAKIIERYLSPITTKGGRTSGQRRERGSDNPLNDTMDVFSGTSSLSEALQNTVVLSGDESENKGKALAFAKLKAPGLRQHHFREMLARLNRAVPKEPLASAVPAEFWYLRAKDLNAAFELGESLDGWGAPFARLWGNSRVDRGLLERYTTELGLNRSEVSRVLGPAVVEQVALVGSDPYVQEGTDVTALFELKSSAVFRTAVATSAALQLKRHGGGDSTERTIDGVAVTFTESADGAVHQWATVNDRLGIVSNSEGAMTRVIETLHGKRSTLDNEADFRYLLARDRDVAADTLVYLSDRFIAEVAGPRQRILESRRVRRQLELQVPSHSAMLFGFLEGRSPRDLEELLASGWLRKRDLLHADGTKIEFQPGQPPKSFYGTPTTLKPIIDLPTPTTVTQSEASAYADWANQYENTWSEAVDPAMLRMSVSGGKTRKVTTDLRVMPLLLRGDFSEFFDAVGEARVEAQPMAMGMRLLLGLSADAEWRRQLNRKMGISSLVKGMSLDIIGEWAVVGTPDTNALVELVSRLDRDFIPCQRRAPRPELDELSRFPYYAGIAIKDFALASVGLMALRQLADSALGEQIEWSQVGNERGVTMTRVRANDGESSSRHGNRDKSQITVYFALMKDAFYVAQSETILRQLIDDQLDGKGPRAVPESGSRPDQVVFDVRPTRRGKFEQFLMTLTATTMLKSSMTDVAQAESLFRGVPELAQHPERYEAVARAYLGFVPSVFGEHHWSFGSDGLSSPVIGTAIQFKLPRRSTLGPEYRSFFDGFVGARSAVAFDVEDAKSEPVARSLHTRVEFEFVPSNSTSTAP